MIIPEKLKVGGKTYDVVVDKNLFNGAAHCTAEVDETALKITIYPSAPDKMEADLLHEMMHAIYDHLGYKEHDEKVIDELANALHMVIKDNPGVFAAKTE
jgi:Uncharacterized protein conserved in bacteria